MSINKLWFFLIIFMFLGCGKKEEAKIPKPAPVLAEAQAVETPQETEKEPPVYVYGGDRFRDPFTPVGIASSYVADAVFEPQRAVLKAILFGSNSRGAVLNIGGSGSYFVKAGRIVDIMGKTIEGFKARVEKDRVIIKGDAEDEYVIKIRETVEDES